MTAGRSPRSRRSSRQTARQKRSWQTFLERHESMRLVGPTGVGLVVEGNCLSRSVAVRVAAGVFWKGSDHLFSQSNLFLRKRLEERHGPRPFLGELYNLAEAAI